MVNYNIKLQKKSFQVYEFLLIGWKDKTGLSPKGDT